MPLWLTKKAIAWSLYDFADTAFSALFITFFFPIFIKSYRGGNEFQIGLSMGLSVLAAAFLVPFIGAASDISGRRMPILVWTAFATAIIAVSTGYAGLGMALLLGFLANITHLISKDVYDAKMIDIAPRAFHGSLSGLGVGIGYFGTIASLVIGYALFSYFGWETLTGIQAMFWEAGVFYVIFSLPLFFLVPDKPLPIHVPAAAALRAGITEVKQTLVSLAQFPTLAQFLSASFFYNNGMQTVIVFLALYGKEAIGIGIRQFFPLFGFMALAAAGGSFIFGWISDRIGPAPLIKALLFVWIGIVMMLSLFPHYWTFVLTGIVGGAALGAIWTLNRHMMLILSPEKKIAELLGFEGLTEKFSGLLGPIIFGYLAAFHGYTPALISVILFLVIGLLLMRGVR